MCRMLIDACNPMLCPIRVFRCAVPVGVSRVRPKRVWVGHRGDL